MEIEEQVDKIVREAYLKQENLPKEINNKCNRIDRKLLEDYNTNIKKASTSIKRDCVNKMDELKKEKINRFDYMDKIFGQNHTKWENEIFNNIINS